MHIMWYEHIIILKLTIIFSAITFVSSSFLHSVSYHIAQLKGLNCKSLVNVTIINIMYTNSSKVLIFTKFNGMYITSAGFTPQRQNHQTLEKYLVDIHVIMKPNYCFAPRLYKVTLLSQIVPNRFLF